MKKFAFILSIILSLFSCKASKQTKVVTKKSKTTIANNNKTASTEDALYLSKEIIQNAKKYLGTKYKYAGTTKKGMDCSGLIYTSFKQENISLPRTTKDLSKTGDWIDLKKVKKGDLLFFATKKNSRNINHVGIVTRVHKKEVEFIHASTSKGVIISSLKEKYWYFAFVQSRRIL